ncbi:MAG: sterol desaturase family protein [Nitrospirae bacterium]|nr:sterol desaturase family protein [Nitrospirota bacterium]
MNYEIIVRLGFFLGVFSIMAIYEYFFQRRTLTTPKKVRWFSNLSIVFIDAAILRLLFPVMAVNLAQIAQETGWGLMNNVSTPYLLSVIVGVLTLDLVIYLQHVMFHTIPAFWRVHMMHHADLDFDVSTGLRFHPIEILLSMLIKMVVVLVIGPPFIAVLIFEVLLNATSMFNHGNIRIPINIDKVLRLLVVTPDMHRVHHSVVIRETNSNFGFNFPWWDRLLGTYRAQPSAGHSNMVIGLSQFRDAKRLTLPWMLALPFIGDTGTYAINQRGKEPEIS